MAYFKLISGNIAADSKLTSVFNAYSLYHSTGIFSTEDYKIMENLVTLTQITEENQNHPYNGWFALRLEAFLPADTKVSPQKLSSCTLFTCSPLKGALFFFLTC